MSFEQSQRLETRLRKLLDLLRRGSPSAETLVRELGVSQPTLCRCLSALRSRGHRIRAVKEEGGWSYRLSPDNFTRSRVREQP
jgi:biotin operon repressor